jgi:hypothetical protein
MTVTLAGVDVLTLRTKALIAAARRGLSDGMAEGAQILVEEEKTLVAVGTGNLRDHIHAELVEATDTRITVIVTPVYDDPNEYGFDPAYARRIERGFIGPDKLGRVYHQAAQPYVRPSWDARQGDVRETIKDRIVEELDAAVAR